MTYPPILIVDEADKPIGSASVAEAHAQGLIHRIVYVMVESPDGQILLQKRSPQMLLYPNRWDTAAAGHVDVTDDYETAAYKELREELGIDLVLHEVGHYRSNVMFDGRQLNRFSKVYRAVTPPETVFKLEAEEVASTQWFTHKALQRLVETQPEQITSGLAAAFNRYYL